MTKLALNAPYVGPHNDALVPWAIGDVANATTKIAGSVANVVSPPLRLVVDNTSQLIRKPITTLKDKTSYGNFITSFPAMWAHALMSTLRLPVSSIDAAANYVIHNNIHRGVETVKALTTTAIGNIISNNWKSRFKALRWLAIWVEGLGDLVWSIIQLPSFALAKWTSLVDKFLSQATTWTQNFLEGCRITPHTKFPVKTFINSWDMPQAPNMNRPPVPDVQKKVA